MPRPRRSFSPGISQHIIQRGNNRIDIFRCTADFVVFLLLLQDALVRFGVDLHAYVLMTNHIHLLVTPRAADSVSRAMHRANSRYVMLFNREYARTGSLFEGRYRSTPVDTEVSWFRCARYIELNPVRARMVSAPGDYRWSSYRAHAFGKSDHLVAPHHLYDAMAASPDERQESWRALCQSPVSDEDLAEIRAALHRPARIPLRTPFQT
jgi:putative transposase